MYYSLTLVLLLAFALTPELASACAVCSAGRDEENRLAFLFMTIFMSLTPILLIGGLVYWIRRRFLALAARETNAGEIARAAVQNS